MKSIDGVHDLLTALASPSVFYDQLQREIAIAERYKEVFYLIKFRLIPNQLVDNSTFELALLNLSRTLLKVSRAEDFLTRLGNVEFILIFHGHNSEVDYLVKRLEDNWQDQQFNLLYSSVKFHLYEGQLSLLRRMDEGELRKLST